MMFRCRHITLKCVPTTAACASSRRTRARACHAAVDCRIGNGMAGPCGNLVHKRRKACIISGSAKQIGRSICMCNSASPGVTPVKNPKSRMAAEKLLLAPSVRKQKQKLQPLLLPPLLWPY